MSPNKALRLTPRRGTTELIQAIAMTQVEFVLIQPFLEGNGRLVCLLSDVMAMQARRSPPHCRAWDTNCGVYFRLVQTEQAV